MVDSAPKASTPKSTKLFSNIGLTRCSAVPAPMPLLAPVMSTTFEETDMVMIWRVVGYLVGVLVGCRMMLWSPTSRSFYSPSDLACFLSLWVKRTPNQYVSKKGVALGKVYPRVHPHQAKLAEWQSNNWSNQHMDTFFILSTYEIPYIEYY